MVWNSECFHVYSPGKVNNQCPPGIQKQQKGSSCGTEQALKLGPWGVRPGTEWEVALSQDFLTEALTSVKLQGLLEAQ